MIAVHAKFAFGPDVFGIACRSADMDRVEHHGRNTAYRSVGDGRILCIHGSGGTHVLWNGQRRLRDGVTTLDLSGHGASDDVDVKSGEPTLEAYADDVEAVARETGGNVLVGNSLGGAVALRVALESDFELEALVLAGTGARLPVLADLLGWLRADFDRAVEFLHEPDRLFHDASEEALERSREALRTVGPEVTHRDFATCDAFDVRDRLDEIGVPALALTGEHDELTPPGYHEYLADQLPGGRWTTIEDAAHLSMVERPAAFNEAVSSFLADVG